MTKRIFFTCLILLAGVSLAFAAGEQEAGTDSGEVVGFNATGYPIVDQPITLNMMAIRRRDVTQPHNEMALIEEVTELTNVRVNWDLATDEDWETRLNLAIASGEYPDAFYGSGAWVDIQRYGIQEPIIVPLNDLVSEYAPNLSAIFERYPNHKAEITFPDGKFYAMPIGGIDQMRTIYQQAIVRQDWLDRLGLEVPKTTDELKAVLTAFREEDADGDGDSGNEIPFSFLYGHSVMGEYPLYGAFGVPIAGNMAWTAIVDDEVVFAPTLDSFKRAVRFMHELYSDGLLDPESFTHDRSVFLAKARSSSVGYVYGWFPQQFQDAAPGMTVIEPISAPGTDPVWPTMPVSANAQSGLLITTANEYPEATVRWGDWWYEEKNSLRAFYGYDVVKFGDDGSIEIATEDETPDGLSYQQWQHLDAPGVNSLYFHTADVINKFPRRADLQEKFETQELLYRDIAAPTWPNMIYAPAEAEVIDLYDQDIQDFVTNRVAEWVVNGTMDDNFDTFMNEVRRLGLDEWLEARNGAYQRYLASQ